MLERLDACARRRSLPKQETDVTIRTQVVGTDAILQFASALDRITHRCHIIETTGESYRLKEARRRRPKMNKE